MILLSLGVTVQALSTVPVMFSYWAKPEDTLDLCQILNNDMAEIVKKYPTRFVGLGTLPMQAPELAVKELKRCKLVRNLTRAVYYYRGCARAYFKRHIA